MHKAGEVDVAGAVERQTGWIGGIGASEEGAVNQTRSGWIQLGDKQRGTARYPLRASACKVPIAVLCGRLVEIGWAAAGDADRIVVRHTQRLNGVGSNREIK